jgi:hypothetical protein
MGAPDAVAPPLHAVGLPAGTADGCAAADAGAASGVTVGHLTAATVAERPARSASGDRATTESERLRRWAR